MGFCFHDDSRVSRNNNNNNDNNDIQAVLILTGNIYCSYVCFKALLSLINFEELTNKNFFATDFNVLRIRPARLLISSVVILLRYIVMLRCYVVLLRYIATLFRYTAMLRCYVILLCYVVTLYCYGT